MAMRHTSLFYIVTTEIIFQGHFLFLRKFCYDTLRTQRAGKKVCAAVSGSATQYITRILENVNWEKNVCAGK